MVGTILAQIGVEAPAGCPLARASADIDSTVEHVAQTRTDATGDTVTEEFATDADISIDHPDVKQVFETDGRRVYRFDRTTDCPCVCACTERHGCPVFDVHASDGILYLTIHALDVDTVQAVVDDLHDQYEDIHVHNLTASGEYDTSDPVLVDRDALTDRQREVLETCHEMGYFDHDDGANATAVARELDIATSTFREHLNAAQRKLLDAVLGP
ncbi:helix-turn-helix domain-containing protein [Haloarchaeobius amylolyticus]|uniref:helix-turn-helix domain-containing protein n=1 Tax=Haloarchaeobius amylolyticus TaxID=1198296 RepID=UPI002271E46B|nr:helix-turn-helix domain-containing protein [Haloarchaeobius amylolyticus]